MKRPNKFFYCILNRIARIYTKLSKNHHLHNPNRIKVTEPSIVISNHTSFFDFLYVMWALKNTPINFVVARKYCETKPLSTILKLGHAIPKSLFQHDTLAIKNMLEIIKKGGVVGMFPEGHISVTGVTLPFPKGLGKLVKKCHVNVYGVKTVGAYLTNPPWTTVKRKGRIDSTLMQILSVSEIDSLTISEIEEKLYQSIYTSPYLEFHPVKFRGKNLAVGLDSLLYLCPNCHKEGTIESNNNRMICRNCKSVYTVTEDANIINENNHLESLYESYMFIRNIEKEKILKNESYEFTLDVKVESIVNSKYKIISNGQLTINKNQICYLSKDSYSFSIDTSQVRYVPFDNGRNFQIYLNNQLYQFIPTKPYLCSKAAIIIELMYELKLKEEPK